MLRIFYGKKANERLKKFEEWAGRKGVAIKKGVRGDNAEANFLFLLKVLIDNRRIDDDDVRFILHELGLEKFYIAWARKTGKYNPYLFLEFVSDEANKSQESWLSLGERILESKEVHDGEVQES